MKAIHVLIMAKLKIENDQVEPNGCPAGKYCPFCAIAQSKTELDRKFNTGISTDELFEQMAFGWKECKEDAPLLKARDTLEKFGSPDDDWSNKEKALKVIQEAINEQN